MRSTSCWSSASVRRYRSARCYSAFPWGTRGTMIIHKFGGSSLRNADDFNRVADIIVATEDHRTIVVAAMSGVTDALAAAVEAASRRDDAYRETLDALQARHTDTVRALLGADAAAPLVERIGRDCEDLSDVLRAAWILRDGSRGSFDMVMGQGEVWAAQILAGALTARRLT